MTIQLALKDTVFWCAVAMGAYFLVWAVFKVRNKNKAKRLEFERKERELLERLPEVWKDIYRLLLSQSFVVGRLGLEAMNNGVGVLPQIDLKTAELLIYLVKDRAAFCCCSTSFEYVMRHVKIPRCSVEKGRGT